MKLTHDELLILRNCATRIYEHRRSMPRPERKIEYQNKIRNLVLLWSEKLGVCPCFSRGTIPMAEDEQLSLLKNQEGESDPATKGRYLIPLKPTAQTDLKSSQVATFVSKEGKNNVFFCGLVLSSW